MDSPGLRATPPTAFAGSSWMGVHLFFNGKTYGAASDAVILDVVAPFLEICAAEKWIERFFFVRYGVGGPHIRLRIRSQRNLQGVVAAALSCHLQRHCPSVGSWQAAPTSPMSSDGPAPTIGLVTTTRWVPYEPEVERYGGAEAMELGEACFDHSSRVAIQLIASMRGAASERRLGQALALMLVTVHTFRPERIGALTFLSRSYKGFLGTLGPVRSEQIATWDAAMQEAYDRQSEELRDQVCGMWQRLDAGESVSALCDRYRRGLLPIRNALRDLCRHGLVVRGGRRLEWQEAVSAIAPSYVHMMNNRLGMTLGEEAYLHSLAYRALGHAFVARSDLR